MQSFPFQNKQWASLFTQLGLWPKHSFNASPLNLPFQLENCRFKSQLMQLANERAPEVFRAVGGCWMFLFPFPAVCSGSIYGTMTSLEEQGSSRKGALVMSIHVMLPKLCNRSRTDADHSPWFIPLISFFSCTYRACVHGIAHDIEKMRIQWIKFEARWCQRIKHKVEDNIFDDLAAVAFIFCTLHKIC